MGMSSYTSMSNNMAHANQCLQQQAAAAYPFMTHHAASSHINSNGAGRAGSGAGGHPGVTHPHAHPYGAIDPLGSLGSAYSRHQSCQSAAAQMHAHAMQNGQFGNGGANSTGKSDLDLIGLNFNDQD